jgi:hypothetical protein
MTTTLTHRMQDETAKRGFSADVVRRTRLAAGLALLITAVALAFANFAGNGGNGGPAEYAVSVGVCAILAGVLFGRVLPNAADPARAGWILAAFALLTCLAFWSGLPIVLGFAAIYAGTRAERAGPVALGALAVVAACVGCVVG